MTICESTKLEIEILISIGINFDAEVLNEFGVFLLLERQNQTARSPNENDRAANMFKFQNDTRLTISVLAAFKGFCR